MKYSLENQTKQYRIKSKFPPIIYNSLKAISTVVVFFSLLNNAFLDYYIPM